MLLVNLPMFHIGGVGWSTMALYKGGTGIVVRENLPGELVDLMERHAITNAFLVPALLQFMRFVQEYEASYLAALPISAQDTIAFLLAPTARALGYQSYYSETVER